MKQRITKIACILGVWLLLCAGAWAGDGQIDIAEIPYTISSSGSYIVVKDLSLATTNTSGITIDADNVTLDLNGHAIIGPGKAAGTSGNGIYVSGLQYNIAIRNGTLRDWRLDGVYARYAHNSQFEALRCHDNGSYGIAVGNASTVSGNTCSYNGGHGIETGFGGTVTDNACNGNGWYGINASNSITVRGNACYGNTMGGIQSTNSLITENTCTNNGTNYNLTTCTSVNNHP